MKIYNYFVITASILVLVAAGIMQIKSTKAEFSSGVSLSSTFSTGQWADTPTPTPEHECKHGHDSWEKEKKEHENRDKHDRDEHDRCGRENNNDHDRSQCEHDSHDKYDRDHLDNEWYRRMREDEGY